MFKRRLFSIIVSFIPLLFMSLWSFTHFQQDASDIAVKDSVSSVSQVHKNDTFQLITPSWINDHNGSNTHNGLLDRYHDTTKSETKPYSNKKLPHDWLQQLLSASVTCQQDGIHYDIVSQNSAVKRPIVLVQLSGAMGNNLAKIAHGVSIALWMYDEHNLMPQVVLQHQSRRGKWKGAAADVQECFPNLRHWNFSLGNTAFYDNILAAQKSNYLHQQLDLTGINFNDEQRVSRAVRNFVQLWTNATKNEKNTDLYDLPILVSNYLSMYDVFIDRYYDEIREFLRFDKQTCCGILPEPEESVFHYRKFLREMPRKGLQYGYEELGPQQVATRIFKDMKPNSKLAIITPRSGDNDTSILPYLTAIHTHNNASVRAVLNQRNVQDFCFLMQVSKEVVGNSMSTFFVWATLLGSRTAKARVYSVDSVYRRTALGDQFYARYKWQYAKELQHRYHFELYMVNESYIPPKNG